MRNRNTIFLTFLYNFTVQDSFGIAVIHLRLKMPMKWWNKNQLFLVYLEAFSSSKLIIVLINEKIMSLLRVFSVENKRRKLLWEFLLILKRIVIWENSWDSNLRIRPGIRQYISKHISLIAAYKIWLSKIFYRNIGRLIKQADGIFGQFGPGRAGLTEARPLPNPA